jgi:AcrR family transcriptional regulator
MGRKAVSSKKPEGDRPVRGTPAQTRERLVSSAAELFNRCGYHGIDSNRIAKEAGYATGTFYKHFADKREAFLAAYEKWARSEWEAVRAELAAGGTTEEIARRLVAVAVDFHIRWRGLRASLLELVFADSEVRRFYRAQRRKQIDLMAEIRAARGGKVHTREEDAIHLYTCERTYDAIAGGELEVLGLSRETILEAMVRQVVAILG